MRHELTSPSLAVGDTQTVQLLADRFGAERVVDVDDEATRTDALTGKASRASSGDRLRDR